MDDPARAHVRLLLEDASARAQESVKRGIKRSYAAHAKRSGQNRPPSVATLTDAVDIFEAETAGLIARSVAGVAAVTNDVEAFEMIVASTDAFKRFFQNEFDKVVKTTTGATTNTPIVVRAVAENRARLTEACTSYQRQLELDRFSFTALIAPTPDSAMPATYTDAKSPPKNRGGKPLAKHWDEMWAAIAFRFWLGDFDPKTQRDVTEAMLDWFTTNEIDVGQTAVTSRARTLWLKIEASRLS